MAQLKDLLVTGPSRLIGDAFANNFQAFRVTSDWIPITNNVYNLGSSSLRWKDIYTVNVNVDNITTKRIIVQDSTTNSNAYGSANPTITFKNSGGDQCLSLVFSDYDSIATPTSQTLSPSSLTLIGNQGGEQFVAPKVRVGGYINNTYDLSANTAIINSWIRTVGKTGWYSESYGGGWYMEDSTWIKSYGSKSIYQNTGILRTDGTFQVGDGGKYVQFNSDGIKLGDTTAIANKANLITINGHVVINAAKNTSNSWSEGIRINNGSNNWSCLAMGGDDGSTSATSKATWTLCVNRHDTTNKVSNMYLAFNGSNSASMRITGHATNSTETGFSIRPRLSINADPDTSYVLYTNGSAYIKGTLKTEGYLYLGSSKQSDTTAPTNKGIYIHDLRNITPAPNSFGANNVQFYFDSGTNDTGRKTTWSTVMHVNGWTAGNYAAHQLSFNADNTTQTSESFDGNLYHRSGVSAWNPWRTIIDSYNIMNEVEVGGLNLLQDTLYLDNWSGTKAWTADAPFTWCAVRSALSPASDSSTSYVDISRNNNFTPQPSTYYTLSFWAKASTANVKIHNFFYPSITAQGYNSQGKISTATDGNIVTTLSTAWQRYWVTWKTNSTISNAAHVILARIYRDEHPGVTIYIALPKMEIGKIHSDWTANPGDAVHIFGRSAMTSSAAHYTYSGGGYHGDNNSIVLHGNTTNGISGIVFLSEKGIATNINSPSDHAFIQYIPYGLTAAAEGTSPTLATSGEAGRLVIGIGNDAADQVWLQAPDSLGVKHQIGANSYTIADTNNVSWSAWTAGTSAGPKANISFAGVTKTSAEIPSASTSASGIVTNAAQSFAGLKTFEGGITAGTASANGIGIAQTNGTGLGLSLYGGHKTSTPEYGITFATTGNLGKFGDVQGDWATYFTMNATNQRGWIWKQYNSTAVSGMSASLSSRGVATFKAVAAEDGYIVYPQGGYYCTSTTTVTGMLKIKLPVYKKNTMMTFNVRIYTYEGSNKTSSVYTIGGYLYGDSGWYNNSSRAFSYGMGKNHNLTVRMGYDGTVACVTIGETDTTWNYPQIAITDIVYGYSNHTPSTYGYDWGVSFVTTSPFTSTASTITNPAGNTYGRFNDLLTLYAEATKATDKPAGINFETFDSDQANSRYTAYIKVYNDHDNSAYGSNMVIQSGSNMVIGAGESPSSLYSATIKNNTSENMYVVSDGSVYVEANGDTIANRIGFQVNTSGAIVPVKAEAANNNAQNIGASDNKWANIYATTFNGALAGNASSASTVYSSAVVPSSRHYIEFQASPGASSSGNATLRHHNSLSVSSNVSTDNSGTQWTELWIGNSTASGTAGNSQGWIALYSSGSSYTQIATTGTGNNNYFYLPNYSGNGYAVTAEGTGAYGSNTQPVYVAANGRVTALTYTKNRLYYSASTSSFEATNHYASTSKIAINNTSEPSYNFYVSGTSYFSGSTTVNGDFTINSGYKIKSTSAYNYFSYDTIPNAGITTKTGQTPDYTTKNGFIICQKNDETSGIQFNGDYITMWSPCDSYSLVYFDEDSGDVVWKIDGSGNFSGIAAKATELTSTLSVSKGGTGQTSLTSGYVLLGNGTSAISTRAVCDSTSASAISTNNYFVTERDIYYGLPYINNSHSYTSSTTIYAPTAGGTTDYVLAGAGTTSAPTWRSTLQVPTSGDITAGLNFRPQSNNSYTLGSSSYRWSSGYINTALYVGTTSYTSSTSSADGTYIGSGYIDLSATTPYIDFHANKSTSDYTARIIADNDCIKFVFN